MVEHRFLTGSSARSVKSPVAKMPLKREKTFDLSSGRRTVTMPRSTTELYRRRDGPAEPQCQSGRSLSAPRTNVEEAKTSRTRSVSPHSPTTARVENPVTQVKKYQSYCSKMLKLLNSLKDALHVKTEEPLDDEERHRQRKRAYEFGVRFSRNHLYQVKRMVTDLKKALEKFTLDGLYSDNHDKLCRKVVFAYQLSFHALQTYVGNAVFSKSVDVPEKVKELILLIQDLHGAARDVITPLLGRRDKDGLSEKCEEVARDLNQKIVENERNKPPEVKPKLKPKKSSKPEQKYSMYNISNTNWKKKTEALAKEKFGTPMRPPLRIKKKKIKKDKKAMLISNIYTQRMHPEKLKYFGNKFIKFDPLKLVEDGNKNIVTPHWKEMPRTDKKNTPRPVMSQDEDIDTVVQSIGSARSRTSDSASSGDNSSDESSELDKSKLREVLLKAVDHLQIENEHDRRKAFRKLITSIGGKPKREKPSNVKVIHVKSRDLLSEEEREEEEKKDEKEEKTIKESTILELFEEQKRKETEMAKPRKLRTIFKPLKRNSATKSSGVVSAGKIELKVTEKAQELMSYKKQFKEFCKDNIMYKKNMSRKPWEIVARVSSQLIDDTLAEITEGMDNIEIISNLYYSELQDETLLSY